MRSYDQYCGLAKALDLIGDRWTLLIVRELLIREGCRYTDLRNGLPGIATNLLAERLQHLERAGIVYRETAPPPVATDLFHLTSRGQELEAVVHAIGRWGGPLVTEPNKRDAYRSHWLALPLNLHLCDNAPEQPAVTLEIRSGDEPVVVKTVGDGSIRATAGTVPNPAGRLEGTPMLVLRLLTGRLDLKTARTKGVRYDGDPGVLLRFTPKGEQESAAKIR